MASALSENRYPITTLSGSRITRHEHDARDLHACSVGADCCLEQVHGANIFGGFCGAGIADENDQPSGTRTTSHHGVAPFKVENVSPTVARQMPAATTRTAGTPGRPR